MAHHETSQDGDTMLLIISPKYRKGTWVVSWEVVEGTKGGTFWENHTREAVM